MQPRFEVGDRVVFHAIGPKARTGTGTVIHVDSILTHTGVVTPVYWVKYDEPIENMERSYIVLGEGEVEADEERV